MLIYKIAMVTDWYEASRKGTFDGTTKDREDGFIHFSTADQLVETLKLHYTRIEDMLSIAAVDADQLGDGLKWEPSRNGDLFPHLYGALPMTAVRANMVALYSTLADGAFETVRNFIASHGVFEARA